MHRLHALHSLPRSNATISIAGVDYQRPQKVNQDNHFQCGDGISYAAFGVLDGHGLKGHILTQYLAHQLPQRLQQCPSEADPFQESLQRYGYDTTTHHSNATAWLTRTFHQCHWDAVQDPNVNAGRNGATCIVCVFEAPISDDDPSLLHVACVGDSRAIRIRRDNSIDILASETTVHLPDERKRIAKGSIRGNNVFYGPVGIAMTRSLGNAVMLRAGVIPTPIVRTYDWKEGDVVCIATDGVWDVLRNEAVAQIVIEETDATIIAERIVEAAKAKWIGNLPIQDEVKMDDITCTIIR